MDGPPGSLNRIYTCAVREAPPSKEDGASLFSQLSKLLREPTFPLSNSTTLPQSACRRTIVHVWFVYAGTPLIWILPFPRRAHHLQQYTDTNTSIYEYIGL